MNACSIKGCRGNYEARGWCKKHYQRWWRHGDPFGTAPKPRDGWVCLCPISHPNPKCCTQCGFPCVHRMAPHIRNLALHKMPELARQVIDRGNSRSVA